MLTKLQSKCRTYEMCKEVQSIDMGNLFRIVRLPDEYQTAYVTRYLFLKFTSRGNCIYLTMNVYIILPIWHLTVTNISNVRSIMERGKKSEMGVNCK